MDLGLILMLASLPVLLAASGFFSGSETALFSLTRHQRAQLARSPTLAASSVTALLAETRGLLITLLLGNMTINVLYFVLSSLALIRLGRYESVGPVALSAMSVAPLVAVIFFGEVLPKLIAARLTLAWARAIAVPLWLVHRAVAPVRLVAAAVVITPLARLIAPRQKPPALSPAEFESLMRLSQHQGVIDSGEERLLQQVLELSQLKVRDLMVPRVDVRAFDLNQDPTALTALIAETRLRHIPVVDGDLDNVVGIVFARQVLLDPPTTREALLKRVRAVKFVPELQRADRLLIELRKTGTTFAIVVDEYGGTAGLVTLEDVVEHMVGDIAGAYERRGEPEVTALDPGRWRVDAGLSVHDWPDVFGKNRAINGAAELGAVSTVGGLVMARLGRLPRVGDRVRLGNVVLTVASMVGARVDRVEIELEAAGAAAGTPGGAP